MGVTVFVVLATVPIPNDEATYSYVETYGSKEEAELVVKDKEEKERGTYAIVRQFVNLPTVVEHKNGIAYILVGESRLCTCGSGNPWNLCGENSQYCG
jgi:hypothetical protein